ncbi:VQ motif-containing protein 9-like [Benincasa hispida]|uniref:VQ motif-containing protein 9-like n=1 Tax=Benincasa hispida TaxID=102211 RepID=UPI0019002C36|nr:VQ motif-containing protein 9-like [Benincasa hispida]
MDKNCQTSVESTSTSSSATGRDHNSLNLSKISHKISKATSQSQLRKPCFDAPLNQNHPSFNQNPQNRLQSETPPVQPQQQQNLQAQPQQHQPPVYNINKNDFRDVVQKLTGSPAHERFSNPPPIQPPKPQNSRLQRIRPPPLNTNMPPPQRLPNGFHPPTPLNFGLTGLPMAPLSPLPPLPAVHAAAESPVSAYMRYIQNSITTADANLPPPQGFSPLGPLASSCWNNFTSQQQGSMALPPSSAMLQAHQQFQVAPSSPLGFGRLNSPRSSSHNVLSSPNLMMFPASTGQLGFPQLPVSPTVPASSPRWIGD